MGYVMSGLTCCAALSECRGEGARLSGAALGSVVRHRGTCGAPYVERLGWRTGARQA